MHVKCVIQCLFIAMMGEELKWGNSYSMICTNEVENIIMVVLPEIKKKKSYQEALDK